jgi:hypothetical protein
MAMIIPYFCSASQKKAILQQVGGFEHNTAHSSINCIWGFFWRSRQAQLMDVVPI